MTNSKSIKTNQNASAKSKGEKNMTNKSKAPKGKKSTIHKPHTKKAVDLKDAPLTTYEMLRVFEGETVEEIRASREKGYVKPQLKKESVVEETAAALVLKQEEEPTEEVSAPKVEKKKDKKSKLKKPTVIPTPSQATVIDDIRNWFINGKGFDVYEFAGYAGVGKSTVIDILMYELELTENETVLCAPTGTAALNIKEKSGFDARTLHSTFYEKDRIDGRVVWEVTAAAVMGKKLLIIDEGSMVTEQLKRDVLQACREANIMVLVVGDRGQLPPVGSKDVFFSNPHSLLTEIMRQAADNPTVALSLAIRQATEAGQLFQFPSNNYSVDGKLFVRPRNSVPTSHLAKVIENGGIVIAGGNKTRKFYNQSLRRELGHTENRLMEGEYIVIKENDFGGDCPISNGMRGRVSDISRNELTGLTRCLFEPEAFEGSRYIEINEDLLFERLTIKAFYARNFQLRAKKDPEIEKGTHAIFGYCITGHASQGGQWKTVYVINEAYMFNRVDENDTEPGYAKANRWLYTVVTRPQVSLVVLL